MKYLCIPLLIIITSCSQKLICNSELVKNKVLSQLKKEIRHDFREVYLLTHHKGEWEIMSDSATVYPYPQNEIEQANKFVESALDTLKLRNIISKQLDKKEEKCSCEAHLNINEYKDIDMEYTAQKTEDGEIFIKLNIINKNNR